MYDKLALENAVLAAVTASADSAGLTGIRRARFIGDTAGNVCDAIATLPEMAPAILHAPVPARPAVPRKPRGPNKPKAPAVAAAPAAPVPPAPVPPTPVPPAPAAAAAPALPFGS